MHCTMYMQCVRIQYAIIGFNAFCIREELRAHMNNRDITQFEV